MASYGWDVEQSAYREFRSVVESPERTSAGNVVLRIGRVLASGEGWKQTEYVVLSRSEARALLAELGTVTA